MQNDPNLLTQELIIKLISEEMKSNKLIFCLSELMVLVEPYYCDLTRTILLLIGFSEDNRNQALFDQYDELMKGFLTIETRQFHQQLNELAREFYYKLIEIKASYETNH